MMARTSLPPGFRFHPTDVELVKYHLKRKLLGKKAIFEVISELNIYKYSPWDLPDKSCLRSKDLEWYFFCPKETKYATGARMNRATECGYWKSTGKDRQVFYKEQTAGMIKTLIFHKGHPLRGERTDWVMYEYRLLDKELADAGVVQDAYVICKVFQKSGRGPKNGAQYGAPFNEDDYDDDGEIYSESLPVVALSPPELPSNNFVFLHGSSSNGPSCDSVFGPGNTSSGPLHDSILVAGSTASWPLSDPCLSKPTPSSHEVPQPLPDSFDDIISMLDMFMEDSPLLPSGNGNNEVVAKHNDGVAVVDVNDIYSGLGDLDNNWAELCGGGGFSLSSHGTIGLDVNYPTMLSAGNDSAAFLDLNDFNDLTTILSSGGDSAAFWS